MKQQTPILGGRAPKLDDAVKRGLAEAIALHGAGRYADALQTMAARGVLKTATGQSLAGDIHLKQGNPREALKAFDNAVRLAPSAAEPYANRGVALLELGRLDEALAAEDRALRLRPDYSGAHFNRGNVLKAMARFEDAAAAYTRALRGQPQFAEAYLNRGLALVSLDRQPEALEDFGRALRARPNYGRAHLGRAMAYRAMRQIDDAFAAIDAAIAAEPENREAKYFRCDLFVEVERHAEALAAADALLAANPGDVAALAARARALLKLKRLGEGLAAADQVIALDPDNVNVHVTRGALLAELGQEEASLAAIETARRLGASEASYLPVRALARAMLGDADAALADFAEALAADPEAAQTYYNRAFLRLSLGDWPGGWDDYEWRLKQRDPAHNAYVKLAPQWKGTPVAGQRLLVYGEQGSGDTLQFVRYLPRLLATGAAVTLIVQRPLERLIADNFPTVDVAAEVGLRTRFDAQVSLMSLPAIFRETLETLPRQVPYLAADPGRVAAWRERVGEGGLRVGVIWQGARTYTRDATRSIPLAKYAPLAAVPGVRLFSVQAQVGLEQFDTLPQGMEVTRFGEALENNPDGFREMAALMANLDLLVMSDTGPTHLAGALGRPVWVSLSRNPDWRWMRERADTPWYPNMRLFRQETAGDWDGVFARIAAELRELAGQRPAS